MKILVVDDEADVRSVVERALRADGHAVVTAADLEAARERVIEGVELIVLDLRLPDGFGLELCRALRVEGATTPILLLTALTQVSLRVEGLNAGADDYLAKPFAIAELRARVRALGRRGALPRGLIYTYENIVLDLAGRRATRGGSRSPSPQRSGLSLRCCSSTPGGSCRGGRCWSRSGATPATPRSAAWRC